MARLDYLVMEFLEGDTFAAQLAKGPMPLDVALTHAIEIASALDHAHRHGIIHRDLKPANIMLTGGGAKLLDFGLAKFKPVASSTVGDADVTVDGTIVGDGPVHGARSRSRARRQTGEATCSRSGRSSTRW